MNTHNSQFGHVPRIRDRLWGRKQKRPQHAAQHEQMLKHTSNTNREHTKSFRDTPQTAPNEKVCVS